MVFGVPKDHLDRAIGATVHSVYQGVLYTLVFSFSLPRDLTFVAIHMSTALSVELSQGTSAVAWDPLHLQTCPIARFDGEETKTTMPTLLPACSE